MRYLGLQTKKAKVLCPSHEPRENVMPEDKQQRRVKVVGATAHRSGALRAAIKPGMRMTKSDVDKDAPIRDDDERADTPQPRAPHESPEEA
jgi:hypothetical protein